MLPLRELQALFLRSIATTSDRSDDHRFHPELLELVNARGVLGATQRLGIYAEMYWARLLDVLRDDFPRVAAIVGDDRFTTLAAAYLERHPSTNPSVRWVGGDFAAFLAEHGPMDDLFRRCACCAALGRCTNSGPRTTRRSPRPRYARRRRCCECGRRTS